MRFKGIYFFVSVIFYLLFFSTTTAQHYPFTTITNKDGLPQSSVFKIMQDRQGYIWMGTEAGLCRYDGYEFKTYSYHSGLDGNFIFDIEFDANGRLWLGSFGTGIAVFDGTRFQSFNGFNGLPVAFITDIFFSSENELWITSKDKGVIRISAGYRPVIHCYDIAGPDFYGQKIDELPNGDIVVAAVAGLYRFEKAKNYRPVMLNPKSLQGLYVDLTGGIWTGGHHRLFYLKDTVFRDLSSWLPVNTVVLNISSPGQTGVIYVATENGLLVIKDSVRTWMTSKNGLSYDLVKDVTQDSFGNLWVATYGNGATILNGRGMLHYDSDGMGGDMCTFTINEDKNGKIWIGKYYGGYYERTDSTFKKTELAIDGMANPSSTKSDAEGNVYILSDRSVIYKVTDDRLAWTLSVPENELIPLSLLPLTDGTLLICGFGGCFIYNEDDQSLKKIPSTAGKFFKEPFYDEKGDIWMMGEQGEVYQLTKDTLIEYTNRINPLKAAISDGLYDSIHKLWWFASAKGLVVWDGKNKLLLHSGNGLRSDLFFSVTQDHQGRIWAGHVQGLECIDPKTFKVIHLGYDQGFLPVETNAASAYTDSKGNVWFGTLTATTRIDVNEFDKDSTKGILRLEQIEVNGKPVFKESYNDTAYPKLHLRYKQNNINFQIVSLCYTNAKDVKYSWKMENVDEEWTTKVNTREINYTNLSPGDYIFRAKAVNPNGFVTNEISIPIHIAKPIWNTVGFYLLEIVIFSFMVFLSFRFTRQSSNNRLGQIMTLLTIFIVFESGMLYISGYTDKFTNGIPVFQLVMNVILAASLHPLEQRIKLLMRKLSKKKS